MTVQNYRIAEEKSKQYTLDKVEAYKQWDHEYQNWKHQKKQDFHTWKSEQWKKITGKA